MAQSLAAVVPEPSGLGPEEALPQSQNLAQATQPVRDPQRQDAAPTGFAKTRPPRGKMPQRTATIRQLVVLLENKFAEKPKEGPHVRFLTPIFKPLIVDTRDTVYYRLGATSMVARIRRIGRPLQSIALLSLVVFAVALQLRRYGLALAASFGALPLGVPLLYAQMQILRSAATSFMPCYMVVNLMGLTLIAWILYEDVLHGLALLVVSFQVVSIIFWDAIPVKLRVRSAYIILGCGVLTGLGGLKLFFEMNTQEKVTDFRAQNEMLASLPVRAAAMACNLSLYCLYLFVTTKRQPGKLASINSRMKCPRAGPQDLTRLTTRLKLQLKAMQAYVGREGTENQREAGEEPVRVLFSPVPPFVVHARKSLGVYLFGRRLGNLPFLIHKRVPFFGLFGMLQMLAYFTAVLYSCLAPGCPDQAMWIVVLACVGGLSTTHLLSNVLLLKIICNNFEVRFFLAIQILCCGLMVSIFPWKSGVIIVCAFSVCIASMFSDAWPSFIVNKGRQRALGYGFNSLVILAFISGIQQNNIFGGLDSSQTLGVQLTSGVFLDIVESIKSLLTMTLVFMLRCFIFALVQDDSCTLLHAPIVSARMPRSEVDKFNEIYQEFTDGTRIGEKSAATPRLVSNEAAQPYLEPRPRDANTSTEEEVDLRKLSFRN